LSDALFDVLLEDLFDVLLEASLFEAFVEFELSDALFFAAF
jgi:hypothetical protein